MRRKEKKIEPKHSPSPSKRYRQQFNQTTKKLNVKELNKEAVLVHKTLFKALGSLEKLNLKYPQETITSAYLSCFEGYFRAFMSNNPTERENPEGYQRKMKGISQVLQKSIGRVMPWEKFIEYTTGSKKGGIDIYG